MSSVIGESTVVGGWSGRPDTMRPLLSWCENVRPVILVGESGGSVKE